VASFVITGHPLAPTRAPSDDSVMGTDVFDALRRGERWAWERAYGAYARRLNSYLCLRLGGRDAAADALSKTFVRAVEGCSRLRGGPDSLPVHLFRIARRVADEAAPRPETTDGISGAGREVLALRLGAGLSCSEIAKVVGRRTAAVRMDQLRALEALAAGAHGG